MYWKESLSENGSCYVCTHQAWIELFTEIFSEWLLSAVRTGLAPAGTFPVQSTVLDTINKTQKSFWINLRLQFEPSSVDTQVHEKHRAITLWHSELAGLAAALSVPEHDPFNHVQRVLSTPFIFSLVFPLFTCYCDNWEVNEEKMAECCLDGAFCWLPCICSLFLSRTSQESKNLSEAERTFWTTL